MCSLFVTDPECTFFVVFIILFYSLLFVVTGYLLFLLFFFGGGGEHNVQFRVRINLARRNKYVYAFLKHCNCSQTSGVFRLLEPGAIFQA